MNTMKIMTRLILNDMVKVKGQISEMATCLEDEDSRIVELAKSFFSELAKKVDCEKCPFLRAHVWLLDMIASSAVATSLHCLEFINWLSL